MNPEGNIRIVVQALFQRFDSNNSGGLEINELANFFNAAFRELGYNITVDQDGALKAFAKLDRNNDKSVNREEIFNGLKEILIPGGAPVKPDFPPPAGGVLAQAQGGQQPGQQGQQQPGQWGQPGQPGQGQQGQQGQWGQPGQQQPGQPGQQGQWK